MKTLKLPELPFSPSGFGSKMSAETIEFHYGRHHKAYIDNTNKMLAETQDAGFKRCETLEALLKEFGKKTQLAPADKKLFNNAAQTWNHTFFWFGLEPGGSGLGEGPLLNQIKSDFGSMDQLKAKFSEAAVGCFGSGWAWLVKRPDGKLEITSTSNAETPATGANTPILTCDVWEHAYYIDYRNQRPAFVESFWTMINWKFVEKNFKGASTPDMTSLMV